MPILPTPKGNSHSKRLIAVLDIETDRFAHGRVPEPFCAAFMTDYEYVECWGEDCIAELMEDILSRRQHYAIYAHNGGRFDFHYLFPWLDNPIRVINGRIVKAQLGRHQLRDSWSILPVPLAAAGGKKKIDYRIFEKGKRDKPANRRKIRRYLEADCAALLAFVSRFEHDFGRNLTVGQTAIKQLKRLLPEGYLSEGGHLPHLTSAGDDFYRPFYFGGRVQCFRHGDIRGRYVVLDRNSMYPAVMVEADHPWGCEYDDISRLPDDDDERVGVYLAEIEATSRAALPRRRDDGQIDFPGTFKNGVRGRFFAFSHEIRAARKLGLLDVHYVEWCKIPQKTIRFIEYVTYWWNRRQVAREAGDLHGELFAKFMLNSCYGKFGTDPARFREWLIVRPGEWTDDELETVGWGMEQGEDGLLVGPEPYSECPAFKLYAMPTARRWYYDVAVAASVTSAARASLLEAIEGSDDPLYCDTDSLICRSAGVTLGKGLGEWKVEAKADRVVIAGKKLYALQHRGDWTKVRAKGGRLTGPEMVKIARGGIVEYKQDAPAYGLKLEPKFTKRMFEATFDERDI